MASTKKKKKKKHLHINSIIKANLIFFLAYRSDRFYKKRKGDHDLNHIHTYIHSSLFIIIWYWSLNQFYNNITDDVNYTFSQSHSISFWV